MTRHDDGGGDFDVSLIPSTRSLSLAGSGTGGNGGPGLGSEHAQLVEMFPHVQDDIIAKALSDADADLDRAIDLLLTHIFFELDGGETGTSADDGGDVERRAVLKGIDGFAEDSGGRQNGGKRKGNKKSRQKASQFPSTDAMPDSLRAPLPPSPPPPPPPENAWEQARRDIDFIVSRTSLPLPRVSSVYHDGHPSIASTLQHILESEIKSSRGGAGSGDFDAAAAAVISDFAGSSAVIFEYAFQLSDAFPSLPSDYLLELVRLTPSIDLAYELALELQWAFETHPDWQQQQQQQRGRRTRGSGEDQKRLFLPLHLSMAPPPPPSEDFTAVAVRRRPPPAPGRLPAPSSSSSSKAQAAADAHAAAAMAAYCRSARQQAAVQAHAAYRRTTAVNFRGGEAAYRSEVARQHAERERAYAAAAADARVAAQSAHLQQQPPLPPGAGSGSPPYYSFHGALDLHGVGVQDAVRIARGKVAAWWEALGDARLEPWKMANAAAAAAAAGGVGGGGGGGGNGGFLATHHRHAYSSARPAYTVITGVGRHTADGRGKLGPAVARALLADGWKFHVEEGRLVVTGVARRR